MKKTTKIIILITIFLLIVLMVSLIFTGSKEYRPVMKINNEKVVEEEYKMIINKYQANVKNNYNNEEINRKDFWTTNINGETPLNVIMNLAEEELVRKKILSELAKSNDINIETDYKSLKEMMSDENKRRNLEEASNEMAFGLSSYKIEEFYQYIYYNLEGKVKESLKKDKEISDEELEKIYEYNKSKYRYDIGVKMLIGEFNGEENNVETFSQNVFNEIKSEKSIDDLRAKFPEVNFYELEMNSFNTQEGKSGIYRLRWEIASNMKKNEVCKPFKVGENVLVMKCIEKVKNGVQSFEEVKGVLKSQIQDIEIENDIKQKIEDAKVDYEKVKLEKIALEVLQ